MADINHMADEEIEAILEAMMGAEEEVQQHDSDLTAMNIISEELNKSLKINETMPIVLYKARQTVQADAIWLYILDDINALFNQSLDLHSQVNLKEVYEKAMKQIKVGESFEGVVLEQLKPNFVNNTDDDPRCHALAQQAGIKSVGAVPLTCPSTDPYSKERWGVGVLCVGNHKPYEWQPRQKRLLGYIANQMALAINNSQQYSQLQEALAMVTGNIQTLQQMNKQLMDSQTNLKNRLFELEQQD